MKLIKARIQNYRSIKDTGEFEIEELKTIMVGPNEAGKTVLLKALQQLSRPDGVNGFDIIRDYPRSLYNDITTKKVKPEEVEVVRGYFKLDDEDKAEIPNEFHDCEYVVYRKLNNKGFHHLVNAPSKITYGEVKKDLLRLLAHLDKQFLEQEGDETTAIKPSENFTKLTTTFYDSKAFTEENSKEIIKFLEDNYTLIDEEDAKEEARYTKIVELINKNNSHDAVLKILDKRTPVFVLF